jgi:flagellar biogenesis protein FliO
MIFKTETREGIIKVIGTMGIILGIFGILLLLLKVLGVY